MRTRNEVRKLVSCSMQVNPITNVLKYAGFTTCEWMDSSERSEHDLSEVIEAREEDGCLGHTQIQFMIDFKSAKIPRHKAYNALSMRARFRTDLYCHI